MTGRDRLMIMAVAVIVIVGAAWLMIVSPERKKAKQAAAAVVAAESKLNSAHGELGTAQTAQKKYAASYAKIVRLGKAVPITQEVPTLMYELAQASKQKNVDFQSISTSTSGARGGASSSASAGHSSGSASKSSAGFQQMPFTFVFNGSYSGLERMLGQLTGFATRGRAGRLRVNGRLLTVQTVAFAPAATQSGTKPKGGSLPLSATVTATAYTNPPAAPQTGTPGATSTPTSSSSGSGTGSSPTAPAVVGAKP
jgi:hypothetical protein